MRNSKVLAKFRAGQPAMFAQLGFYMPHFVALASSVGYDAIWVDLEHRAFDPREIQALISYFHMYDIDCMIRPSTREKAVLYRYLEDGAAGLIIPHVNDVESARDLVQKVKFPPVGDRGIEGNSLEANFGLDTAGGRSALVEHALRETFLFLQIETPQALSQVEQIAAVKGVDGLFFGPADFGIRIPYMTEAERVTLDQAMVRVANACKANGIMWGSMPANIDDVRRHAELGANMHIWGHDLRALRAGLAQNIKELHDITGS
ncbi:MAG: 4-hydroxy-2-oxovalerate aldolase [Anaerolineae bacterium]|nr:4-hydroxy-2-oxovalerate aldolase [Anaerolineae bacterium]